MDQVTERMPQKGGKVTISRNLLIAILVLTAVTALFLVYYAGKSSTPSLEQQRISTIKEQRANFPAKIPDEMSDYDAEQWMKGIRQNYTEAEIKTGHFKKNEEGKWLFYPGRDSSQNNDLPSGTERLTPDQMKSGILPNNQNQTQTNSEQSPNSAPALTPVSPSSK